MAFYSLMLAIVIGHLLGVRTHGRIDWWGHERFHQSLIKIARPLSKEDSGLDLNNTVYALDASTSLSVSPFSPEHYLNSPSQPSNSIRGWIYEEIFRPSCISRTASYTISIFSIFSDQNPELSMSWARGYVDFKRLFALNQAGAFFVIRAKSNGTRCDQTTVQTGSNTRNSDISHLRRVKYCSFDYFELFVEPCTEKDRGIQPTRLGACYQLIRHFCSLS